MLCLRINKTVHISLQNLRTMWPDLLRSNSISKVWMPKLQTRVITGGKKCQIFICLIAIQCFKVFVFLSFKALNNWNFLELICFQQGQHEYTSISPPWATLSSGHRLSVMMVLLVLWNSAAPTTTMCYALQFQLPQWHDF